MSEIILDVRCLLCPGLIDRVARREVDEAVWAHWQRWHPATPTPVAGASYAVRPAPPVCDTCLIVIERPWWEHVSTPPTPALGYEDGDGRWLLCDPCHDLFTAGNLRGWVQRGWAVAVDLAPWMGREPAATRAQMRLSLADTLHLLIERLDTGRRITVAERP